MRIIREIVEQHAEEAAFLWLLRDQATSAPHYSLDDLAELDERVEAHIDGLRIAGEPGWELCRDALEWQEAGEVFAASVLAFESGDEERVETVLETAAGQPQLERGLVSAIGWLAPEQAGGWIESFLGAEDPARRRIGLAASSVHRSDPFFALDRAVADAEPSLRARALRLAGELGRVGLLSGVAGGPGAPRLEDPDPDCRYFAARSMALLGEGAPAIFVLRAAAEEGGPRSAEACELAVRVLPPADAKVWSKNLESGSKTRRLALQAAGAAGDAALVPRLIEAMEEPELARVAGEAFTRITGVDLVDSKLEAEWPEGFEAGPSEDPEDENVDMDADEDLPWPDPEGVRDWWQRHRRRFPQGVRLFLGQAASPAQLRRVLRSGFQRQRTAAALGLAMATPGAPLFEVRARGSRQQRLLRNGGARQ